jgi:hypothetical protein
VACFEITEINPLLDDENRTAVRVFPIFRDAVNTIEKLKKKQAREQKINKDILQSDKKTSTPLKKIPVISLPKKKEIITKRKKS